METKVSIYLFFLLCLIGCKEESDESVKVFRYNQVNHITSLDPAFAKSQNNIWSTHHLFDGLVKLDEDLDVIPAIAKEWTISEDGKTYRFTLRDDVYFHDDPCFEGKKRKVTAEDFAYSFNRLLDGKVNSPGSWLFSDKVVEGGFRAVNDTTFVIELSKPFIPLMGILTMQYCSVVPREAVEYYGDRFAYHPVGTGPFKFKKWVINQALFLNRNSDYFDTIETNLDGLKTSFIPDKKISYLELLNGRLDYVSGLESSFAPELLTAEGELREDKSNEIRFNKAPYLNTEYIGINFHNEPQDSPLRNKLFRQALNYGIDRGQMLRTLRMGIGKPASSGIIPRGLPSHDADRVKGYDYDPEKARALITESGLSTPISIKLFTNKDYLDLTTFIANQWKDIGINTEIEVLESGILRDGMRKSEIPMFRASWIADYPDGESFLCLFYSKYPAPPNYTRYKNDRYDQLYEKAIKTSDKNERLELYHQMEDIIIDDAPVVFLFYDEVAQFSALRVDGISSNAINLLEVDNLRITE